MPLFNKSVVKMGKGCDLTEEDWIESVKKQDMTYEPVLRAFMLHPQPPLLLLQGCTHARQYCQPALYLPSPSQEWQL